MSPYHFTGGNPVVFSDPTGLKPQNPAYSAPRAFAGYGEGMLGYILSGGSPRDLLGSSFYTPRGGGGGLADYAEPIENFPMWAQILLHDKEKTNFSGEYVMSIISTLDKLQMLAEAFVEGGNGGIYQLFNKLLNSPVGTTLNIKNEIKINDFNPKLAGAINFVKLTAKGKVYVDWNNETKINMFSRINVKDGILNVKFISIPTSHGTFYNGYNITGESLQLDVDSGTYSNLFLNKDGWLYGIIGSPNKPRLTNDSAGLE